MSRVRSPAVAGSFYPQDPRALRSVVEDCLARARRPAAGSHAAAEAAGTPSSRPKALICPHAGYIYSGPIAAGDATPQQVATALEAVWGGEETLIVISSDLSHYLDYARARTVDSSTAQAILDCSTEIDADQACGYVGVNGLLCAARHRHLEVRLLDLRNSGDTQPDRSRVVGYGAFALYEEHARE